MKWEEGDIEASILTALLLGWISYLFVVTLRLIILGCTGHVYWPWQFSWNELEIAGGSLILSAIVAFFVYIRD